MISKMQFMNSVLGKPIVDAVVQTLYNQSNDFPAIYEAYLAAVEKMHTVLGPDAKHEIRKYVTAIEQMASSNLYYSGVQGLKMNYDHFINPMTPNCTWLQVDYDDYLRSHMANQLPLYKAAYRFKQKFEKQLPGELWEAEVAVCSYETTLACNGTKLAHFYGYLMGNELLYHCIPGYRADKVLDLKYTHMIEKYFGKQIIMDQLDGCILVKNWKIAPIPEDNPQDTLVYRKQIWKEFT